MASREVIGGGRAKHVGAALLAFSALRASAAAAEPPRGDVQEVQVHGTKTPKTGQTSLGADEVRQTPGAFGDHFRVIETLPGVTPLVSGLPFFFVRGAPPGNNGYFLDGVRVPLLYHIGLGPSVIHPALIRRVDFYPGGYPARFGRYVGGVLSGETRAPSDEVHGEGNIRVFDAGALVEAPFANGRGHALVSGRYSYTAAIVSLFAPDVRLDYWDYQGRVAWALGPDDTVSAFAFGSHDYLGEKKHDPERTKTILSTQFHRLDLRWDHRLPKRGTMRVAATLGHDSTSTEDLRPVRDRSVGLRMLIEQPVADDVLVHAGADALLDHYDLAPEEQAEQTESSLYPPRNDIAVGTHVDAQIRATPRWHVTPGLRFDYFGSVRSLATAPRFERRRRTNAAVPSVDPRLSSRLELTSRVAMISTFGMTHQTPSFFIPVPGLQLGRLSQGLQTGIQTSQGFEIGLPASFTVTPTVFYHHYLGLSDFATTCGDTSDYADAECIERRVRGRSVGLELLVKRAITERLSGWVSYTLSRTTRATQIYLLGRRGNHAEIPGDFDRTHVVNVIGAYELGRGWRAGGRFFFYTGRPYSSRAFDFPVPPYNNQRMPGFHRFDARLEKVWRIGKSSKVALVFEWLNFTLQKEVTSVVCSTPEGVQRRFPDIQRAIRGELPPELLDQCTFEEIGPVTVPSIGVEGQF